jgi:hypothetical protein
MNAFQTTCIMTRLELRSPLLSPIAYLRFRRVAKQLRSKPSLLAFSFLLENATTWVSVSIWRSPNSIMESAVREHALAVRWAHTWCRAIWSTQWHLTRLSPNANLWRGNAVDWAQIALNGGATATIPSPFAYCSGVAIDMRSVDRSPALQDGTNPEDPSI